MLKTFWNWLTWQFYKGNADKLLAESQAIVERMDAMQKLDYACNGAKLGLKVWGDDRQDALGANRHVLSVNLFVGRGRHKLCVDVINYRASEFQLIARGMLPEQVGYTMAFLTPINMELAYAFWSLQRMLAIVYPNHGFKLEGKVECSDSEALTRIATSIVASVAAAYGHERGCKAYVSVYRDMIDHGKGLVG